MAESRLIAAGEGASPAESTGVAAETTLPRLPAADPRQKAAADRLIRIAGEALPTDLAHLATGPMAAALARAVDFAQASVATRTEKLYAATWEAFRDWCD